MKYQSALGTTHHITLKSAKAPLHTLSLYKESLLSLPHQQNIPPQSCHHGAFTQNGPSALSEKHPLQAISYVPCSLSSVLATQPQTTGAKPKGRKMPIKRSTFQPQKGIDPFHPLPHVALSF